MNLNIESLVTLPLSQSHPQLLCPFIKEAAQSCPCCMILYPHPPHLHPHIRSVHSCPLLLSRSGLCYLCQMKGGGGEQSAQRGSAACVYEKNCLLTTKSCLITWLHIRVKTPSEDTNIHGAYWLILTVGGRQTLCNGESSLL